MVEQLTGVQFNFNADVDDSFHDPDLLWSKLPQPYRMINKVLNEIIEAAWIKIVPLEEKNERLRSRYKAPLCSFSDMIRPFSNVLTTTICEGIENRLILGLTNGLAVVNYKNGSQSNHAVWIENGFSGELINAVKFSKSCDFCIAVADQTGSAKVFLVSSRKLFFVCNLYEREENGHDEFRKVIEIKISAGVEYIGLVVELSSPTNGSKQYILEVYKLPSEEWLSVIRSHLNEEEGVRSSRCSNLYDESDREKNVVRGLTFSSFPTLLLKLEQPKTPQVPIKVVLEDHLKSHDTSREFLGLGQGSLITQSMLDSRWKSLLRAESRRIDFVENYEQENCFDRTFRDDGYGEFIKPEINSIDGRAGGGDDDDNQELKKNVDVDSWMKRLDNPLFSQPQFHFGSTCKHGSNMEKIDQIFVWWKYQPNVYYYNLSEKNESSERSINSRLMQPTSCSVVASAQSSSSSSFYMLLVLSNNNIVIWNESLGILTNVIHIEDKGKIKKIISIEKLHLADHRKPAIGPTGMSKPKIEIWMAALSDSGFIYICDISAAEVRCLVPISQPINPHIDDSRDIPVDIQELDGFPDLFSIMQSDGKLFVYSITEERKICQIVLPENCTLRPNFASITTVGDMNDKCLLVTGEQKNAFCSRSANDPKARLSSVARRQKETEDQTTEEEIEQSETSKCSAVPLAQNCVFVFKLSDFCTSKSFSKALSHGLSVEVSSSTLKRVLSVNKNIVDKIKELDPLRERLSKKWLERRNKFNSGDLVVA